jgi:hypothetical protein
MSWLLVPALILIVAIVFLLRRMFRRALLTGLTAIVMAAIIGVGPVLPSPAAKRNACIYNLRQLDDAKRSWAIKNSVTNGLAPSLEALSEIDSRLRVMPECPAGGVYSINSIGENPTCSRSDVGHSLR